MSQNVARPTSDLSGSTLNQPAKYSIKAMGPGGRDDVAREVEGKKKYRVEGSGQHSGTKQLGSDIQGGIVGAGKWHLEEEPPYTLFYLLD